jgi:hypothetical protein
MNFKFISLASQPLYRFFIFSPQLTVILETEVTERSVKWHQFYNIITNFKEVIIKKKHTIISCILIVGIIFSGLALADSQRTGHRKSHGFKQHPRGYGLQLLAGYQQKT